MAWVSVEMNVEITSPLKSGYEGKKYLNWIKKGIISSEKVRKSGNYVYDFAELDKIHDENW